jgi:hypothetical protein
VLLWSLAGQVTLIVQSRLSFHPSMLLFVTQAPTMHSMALSGASSVCFSQGGQQQQQQQ